MHISQHCPSPGAPPLESVDVRQIYDKFPEKKGGLRELYDRGPPHAFFLVKFWVSFAAETKCLQVTWSPMEGDAQSVSPLWNRELRAVLPPGWDG